MKEEAAAARQVETLRTTQYAVPKVAPTIFTQSDDAAAKARYQAQKNGQMSRSS